MRTADFESLSGSFTISPYVIDGTLTHIELLTRTGRVTINCKDIEDLISTLQEIEQVYIKKASTNNN